MNDDLRYPIGRFVYDGDLSREAIDRSIADIAALPRLVRASASGLDADQLNTPYRDGGWTIRQVVHHLPDSHMNAYVRSRLALTEQSPTAKPYDEAAWAELGDVKVVPIETSLALLEALHERWVATLRSLPDADFERGYIHPAQQRLVPLREVVALYSWHGRHHTAHISSLRERNGWG